MVINVNEDVTIILNDKARTGRNEIILIEEWYEGGDDYEQGDCYM